MQPFDQEAFFARIATDLHEQGVLKTYDQPQGKQEQEWPGYVKRGHADHAEGEGKNTPGLVQHAGDEPYNRATFQELHRYGKIKIGYEHLRLKSGSVVKAIRSYMPPEKFDQYLQYFTANLDKPSHKEALNIAFQNIGEQLGSDEEKMPLQHIDAKIEAAKTGSSNDLRASLPLSTLAFELAEQPELMLSIAIYQAAHMTYLDQLSAAIKGHKDIAPDEHENAGYVIDGPFKQFRTSLVFASLAPLIMRERIELGQQVAKGEAPEESGEALTKKAIAAGWKTFFDTNVLTRDYPAEQIAAAADGSPAKLTCPAISHLKGSMQQGSLEQVYDYVTTHRSELKEQLKDVAATTRGATGLASEQGWANFRY